MTATGDTDKKRCVRVYLRVFVRVCVFIRVCVCVCGCVCEALGVCVGAGYLLRSISHFSISISHPSVSGLGEAGSE